MRFKLFEMEEKVAEVHLRT